jgi:DNA-binding HxlR family transcriptional regulator
MSFSRNDHTLDNPVSTALVLLSGKWKFQIVFQLRFGGKRTGVLKRALGAITDKTLIGQLRELEEDGIVVRQSYGEVPPRVEYSLTPLGQELEHVYRALEVWGQHYLATERGRLVETKCPIDSAMSVAS